MRDAVFDPFLDPKFKLRPNVRPPKNDPKISEKSTGVAPLFVLSTLVDNVGGSIDPKSTPSFMSRRQPELRRGSKKGVKKGQKSGFLA